MAKTGLSHNAPINIWSQSRRLVFPRSVYLYTTSSTALYIRLSIKPNTQYARLWGFLENITSSTTEVNHTLYICFVRYIYQALFDPPAGERSSGIIYTLAGAKTLRCSTCSAKSRLLADPKLAIKSVHSARLQQQQLVVVKVYLQLYLYSQTLYRVDFSRDRRDSFCFFILTMMQRGVDWKGERRWEIVGVFICAIWGCWCIRCASFARALIKRCRWIEESKFTCWYMRGNSRLVSRAVNLNYIQRQL